MPRHSKNANSRTFNSYYEKKKNASGSQSLIFGSDSVKPFDYCTLCLHHVVDPLSCEKGHLFCKECIYKYLLSKKKEYEEQMEAYQQMIQDEEQEVLENTKTAEAQICDDIERMQSVSASEHKNLYINSVETKEDKEFKEMKQVVDKLSRNYDDRTDEEKSLAMNFWIPQNTPEFKDRMKMPSKEIACPGGGHEVSRKKLIELHFTVVDDNFTCPACLKVFQHQQVIVIKQCGHCLCGDCFKKFVGPSKQCYCCQTPVLKKKDFLVLESGGTGFSSHNKVDVKVYKPNENYLVFFKYKES